MGADIQQKIKVWHWQAPWYAHLAAAALVVLGVVPTFTISYLLTNRTESQLSLQAIYQPWAYNLSIAVASTLLCLVLAPIVAYGLWVLNKRTGPLLRLMALPYCLPSIAVGGMLVLTVGDAGFINRLLLSNGFLEKPFSMLYRTWSPLWGTVWMNLSLGVFLLLRAWSSIPAAQLQQAEIMQFTRTMILRQIVLPHSLSSLVPWGAMVFFACLSSFGLMLMLSGSPAATTLELATWQALFYEADWHKAALLMLAQLTTSVVAALFLWSALYRANIIQRHKNAMIVDRRSGPTPSFLQQAVAYFVTIIFSLFYILPLFCLILEVGDFLRSPAPFHGLDILQACKISLENASVVTIFTILATYVLVSAQQQATHFQRPSLTRWLNSAVYVPAIVPGMCVSFALLALSYRVELDTFKMFSLWLVQSFAAIPAAAALYGSGWSRNLSPHFRIQEELNLSTFTLWQKVERPLMLPWLLWSSVLAASLSISDTTAASLLSATDEPPLTLLLGQLMGSYRFGEASLTILILIGISSAAFYLTAGPLLNGDHNHASL